MQLFVIFLLMPQASPGRAESVEMTTYYPAPSGTYQRMTTTNQTVLARDGGSVGVGVAAPARKLDVAGDARMSALVLQPQDAAPVTPVDGMLYFNQADKLLYIYANGAWGRVMTFAGQTLAETTGGPMFLDGSLRRVMVINFRTTKRGLYSLVWNASVAVSNTISNRTATIIVRHCGGTLIQRFTVDDPDDLPTMDIVPVDGSTMLNLSGNTNYCIEMRGSSKILGAEVQSGAFLRLDELFAF